MNRIKPAETERVPFKAYHAMEKHPSSSVPNDRFQTWTSGFTLTISFDAAALDELQATENVIFVVSGTNDNRMEKAVSREFVHQETLLIPLW